MEQTMEKPKKEPKRKPKYGLISCVGYMYRYLWKYERRLVIYSVLTVPVTLIAAAFSLYTPSLILEALGNSEQFSGAALVIVGVLMAEFLAGLANSLLRVKNDNAEFYIFAHLTYLRLANHRTRDWYHQYSESVQELDERAVKAVNNNHAAGVHLPMNFAAIVATILNFILFGGVVTMLQKKETDIFSVCPARSGLERIFAFTVCRAICIR